MTQPYRIIDLSPFVGPLTGDELVEISQGGAASFKTSTATIAASARITYYVSPTGNDNNDGNTSGAPWQTIAKVNAQTFLPGTAILFQGGQSFSGAILCPSSGTTANPIVFGSYGNGQATINSTTSNGFDANGQSGIVVRDLIFAGSAAQNYGIAFNLFTGPSVLGFGATAINCNCSGYGLSGINVNSYNDVLLQQCVITNCCLSAPTDHDGTNALGLEVCNNIRVLDCIVHDNPGATDLNGTATGVIVDKVTNGYLSKVWSYNNGTLANATSHSGGPSGFVIVDCNFVTLNDCVAHHNTVAVGSDGIDGNGIFMAEGNTNCSFVNCLSYSNWGAGYIIFSITATWDSNSFINCTSNNNGTGGASASNPYGLLISRQGFVSSPITNLTVANCVFNEPLTGTTPVHFITAGSNTSITGTFTGNRVLRQPLSDHGLSVPFITSDFSPLPPGFAFESNIYQCDGNQVFCASDDIPQSLPSIDNVFAVTNAIADTTDSYQSAIIQIGNNSFAGAELYYKTRGTTAASRVAVQNGDGIGGGQAFGADGSFAIPTANWSFIVDGAVSSSVVPTGIAFNTGSNFFGTECFRLTSSGATSIIGTSGVFQPIVNFQGQTPIQQNTTDATNHYAAALAQINANTFGATLAVYKTRATITSSHVALQNGDNIGGMQAQGDDGTSNIVATAGFTFAIDGSVSTNNIPTNFTVYTGASNFGSNSLIVSSAGGIHFPRISTTASAANAFLDNTAGNNLLRSTSSLRYKTEITAVPQHRIDAALALEPIEYKSLASADSSTTRFVGLTAEEVAKIDPALVSWDYDDADYDYVVSERGPRSRVLKANATKRPDGVMYDRVLLLQVAALKTEILELKKKLVG